MVVVLQQRYARKDGDDCLERDSAKPNHLPYPCIRNCLALEQANCALLYFARVNDGNRRPQPGHRVVKASVAQTPLFDGVKSIILK